MVVLVSVTFVVAADPTKAHYPSPVYFVTTGATPEGGWGDRMLSSVAAPPPPKRGHRYPTLVQ